MGLFRRSRCPPSTIDWGELRPRRLREHQDRPGEGGRARVSVLVPRIRSALFARLTRSMELEPYLVHLDEVGSFIWLHCDGAHRVAEIGEQLRAEFGEQVLPLEERLTLFLSQLARGRLIDLGDARPAGRAADQEAP